MHVISYLLFHQNINIFYVLSTGLMVGYIQLWMRQTGSLPAFIHSKIILLTTNDVPATVLLMSHFINDPTLLFHHKMSISTVIFLLDALIVG